MDKLQQRAADSGGLLHPWMSGRLAGRRDAAAAGHSRSRGRRQLWYARTKAGQPRYHRESGKSLQIRGWLWTVAT